MSRSTIGEALAVRLYAAESSIDRALADAAALAAALPAARAEAYLSAVTGQRAFSGAAAAVGALTDARGHLIQTHHTLAALARSLGLHTLARGPVDKPGDTPPVGGGGVQPANDGRENMVNKSLPDIPKLC